MAGRLLRVLHEREESKTLRFKIKKHKKSIGEISDAFLGKKIIWKRPKNS